MGTKYSTQTIAGYNAGAPSDDASQTEANKIKWATHKTKLVDPVKTLAEAINSTLVTTLNTSARAASSTQSLSATDHWKTIECTTVTAGITISLADATTMAAGYITTVFSSVNSIGDVSIDLVTATDDLNNVSNGVMSIGPGAAVTFIVNAAADGYITMSGNGATSAATMDFIVSQTRRRMTHPPYDTRASNMPAGMINQYAGSTLPTGWLACDGTAYDSVTNTQYAGLYTAIGITWGGADGTSFKVPDLRGRTLVADGTGTVAELISAGSVSVSADTLEVTSNGSKWISGMLATLTTTGGAPAGLSAGVSYYVIRVSATLIQLATTLANAQNGTQIDITTQGTGIHTLTHTLTARTLGQIGGEETHAMSSTEALAHTHGINVASLAGSEMPRLEDGSNRGTFASEITSDSTGGNAAMNNMQPFGVVKYIISY